MAKRMFLIVVIIALALTAAAQDREKVRVCHFGGPDAQLLTVARSALPAHLGHGDVVAPPSVKSGADCLVPQPAPAPAQVAVTADERGTAFFQIPSTNVMARVSVVDPSGAPVPGAAIELFVIGGDFLVIADDPDGRLGPGVADGKLADARSGSALQVSVAVTMHQQNMPPPPFVTNLFVIRDDCYTKKEFQDFLETSCTQTLQLGRKKFLSFSGGNVFTKWPDDVVGRTIDQVCADYAADAADEAFHDRSLPRNIRVYSPPSTISPKVMPFYATDFGECGGSCCEGRKCTLVSKAGNCGAIYRDLTPCSPAHPCVVGACCDGNGCAEVTEEACIARGGTYRGDHVPCAPDPCRRGACCLGNVCAERWEFECNDLGGTFLGDKTTCVQDLCRKGACCTAAGCIMTNPIDCAARDGKYQGDDILCTPDRCDRGACCDPRTGCTVVSSVECENRGGRFHGRDTTCDRIAGKPFKVVLQSGGGLGGASFPIPFTHGTIRTRVTIPGNSSGNQCNRNWRVDIRVCPFNAGCQGGSWSAGQHFSICHTATETITAEQLNPQIPCSVYSVNAVTGSVSTVEVEIVP